MASGILKHLKEALMIHKSVDSALNALATELNLTVDQLLTRLQNEVEGAVKSRFIASIVEELEKQKPPLEKINVTDLTFPCLRHAYYSKIFYEEKRGRLPELLAFWIGVKLHETKIAQLHELEVEYNGIYGRVDGYEDGVIYELKTVRTIPSTPYSHHIRQVEYYRVLLEKNGYHVSYAIIIYVNVNNLSLKSFLILFDRSLEEVEIELLERKNKLLEHLNKREAPPPIPDEPWACDYCRFAYLCGFDQYAKKNKRNPNPS